MNLEILSYQAHHLHLPVEPVNDLKVMIGNGNFLHAEGIIWCVPLQIQDHMVQFPASVLPVSGVDIILGVAWLATLGSRIADYRSSSIKFYHGDKFITLHDESSLTPTSFPPF